MSNKLLVSLFEYKAWANRGLYDALLAAPPGEHAMEMAIVTITLDHVSVVDQLFKARLAGGPEPFAGVISPQLPALAALRETVAKTDAWYVDYVRAVPQSELNEVLAFTFTDGDPGRMSRAEMLGHVLTHGNSHRGAVGQMLGTIKVKGAPDMLTSFLSSRRN
ncbi:MAG: DinB family protein [Rhizomicrobium sp.]